MYMQCLIIDLVFEKRKSHHVSRIFLWKISLLSFFFFQSSNILTKVLLLVLIVICFNCLSLKKFQWNFPFFKSMFLDSLKLCYIIIWLFFQMAWNNVIYDVCNMGTNMILCKWFNTGREWCGTYTYIYINKNRG